MRPPPDTASQRAAAASTGAPAPGSPSSLRTANQRRVLKALRATRTAVNSTALTQADLARETGLAPATISNIVKELEQTGIIETIPGSGRRGTKVALARAAGLVAGVDFGHNHVAVAIGDLTGRIIADLRRPASHDNDHREALSEATMILDGLLGDLNATRDDLRRIGLGLPGPITDEVVRASAILPGWVGINARAVSEERFGVPVNVDNDANLGALAEHRAGAARGQSSSVFVKASSGVGAGIIVNDQLYRGHDGTAGEIGHLTLDEQGPVCRCGSRGCLETYAAAPAVLSLLSAQHPGLDVDGLIGLIEDGNVAAVRTLEDAGLHLGWGLATVVNLLNPSVIVIGGELARGGEHLLEPARIGLRRHAVDSLAATPVKAATLGARAGLVGAVMLASENTELLG